MSRVQLNVASVGHNELVREVALHELKNIAFDLGANQFPEHIKWRLIAAWNICYVRPPLSLEEVEELAYSPHRARNG